MFFSNTVLLPKLGTLVITLAPVVLPPCTAPVDGFMVVTGQAYTDPLTQLQSLYLIEKITSPYAILQTTTPALLNASLCSAVMNPEANVSVSGVTYVFDITTVNSLVNSSQMLFNFPASIGIPSASALVLGCILGCDQNTSKLAWDANKRILSISTFTNYLPPATQLRF